MVERRTYSIETSDNNNSLQNVVLAGTGDSSNTYSASYTVSADDTSGAQTTFNYNNVVSDFTSHLVNQPEGEGQFSVKVYATFQAPGNGGPPNFDAIPIRAGHTSKGRYCIQVASRLGPMIVGS